MMSHRIQYLRDRKGQPIGCLAIKVRRGVEGGLSFVEYRASILNPQDKFNRAMARQLALGRMMEAPFTVTIAGDPTMYQITLAVMKDIARDLDQPTRARQAAKLWLRSNETPTPCLFF